MHMPSLIAEALRCAEYDSTKDAITDVEASSLVFHV